MTMEHYPVQNSEVFLLGSSHLPNIPPPSPPSPATPCERALSPPPEDLMSMTPPELEPSSSCPSFSNRLENAVHVLNTEATALSCLTRLYETDPIARSGFNASVSAITRFKCDKGKLVICGIGKSGHIAKKLVATMNSLKIHSIYLHPTEALHGDLGGIGKYDTILLITFSGKTPELLQLLPHFDTELPLIVMTSHIHPSTCAIIKQQPNAILLPAPIHKSETDSFGFNAPTTSTTMALALGDALAVVISNELHINVQAVFSQNHPGGAIGQASQPQSQSPTQTQTPLKISDLSIPLSKIPTLENGSITAAKVLVAAYQSPSGWVRLGNDVVMSPRRIRCLTQDDFEEPAVCVKGLMKGRKEWIEVQGSMGVAECKEFVRNAGRWWEDAILALLDGDGAVAGVLEVGSLEG